MSAREALEKAMEADLDLVKISPTAVPPVCKLMDYGKFKFEQTKREKEAKKNQRVVEIKEVRMSPSIDVNDFNVKLRNAQKFLGEGNRVKVTVRFRGREMAHTDIGKNLLVKFAEECGEVATLDKEPKLDGRHMSIFLSPKTAKETKKQEGFLLTCILDIVKVKEITTMPKLKTHSGAKKRFNLTKTGKVKRAHANKRHLLNGHDKDTKRKRGLRAGAYADKTNEPAIKRMIPYK